jgi:hypothetical protein
MSNKCRDPLMAGVNDPAPANYPWDSVGPTMEHGVTQIGYGGAFVIRSNPFGGIIDTIQGFCFPASMVSDGAGGYDAEEGYGTPGTYSADIGIPGVASLGGGGFGGYSSPTPPPVEQQLPMAEVPMQTTGPPVVVSPCGPEALDMMTEKLTTAAANCDVAAINTIRRLAPICEKTAPAHLRGSWKALAANARSIGNGLKCKPAGSSVPVPGGQPIAKRKTSGLAARLQSTKGIPRLPSPMTLTETNPQMQSFFDPMMGHFDPGMI